MHLREPPADVDRAFVPAVAYQEAQMCQTIEYGPEWLHIRTCQREVAIALGASTETAGAAATEAVSTTSSEAASTTSSEAVSAAFTVHTPSTEAAVMRGFEAFRGRCAYRFLLEFAAGLQSAVPGETNVFGQVREAWRTFEGERPAAARELAPLVEQWFRDVRAIRTRFLQGIGGNSYATLARRLLDPDADARVLIVGLGAIGRTMPDKFRQSSVGVFERSPGRVRLRSAVRHFGPGEEQVAAAWATHVVMCVPRLPDLDARWVQALRQNAQKRIVHVGCRRGTTGPWSEIPGLIDLDDLLELQRDQRLVRNDQLCRARAACEALAGPYGSAARAVSSALI